MTSPGPSMHPVALRYARAGWHVFPLRPRAKVPLTEHGCLDATRDPDQVAVWWSKWPTANVGIATGANSGLLVIDIDGEEGELALAELVAKNGPLPLVPEVTTGRGRHLYFSFDERVKNSAKKLPKIDTRSTGGYVVAPPSIHPDGGLYTWAKGASPRERQVVAAPEWLLELFMARKPSPAEPAPFRPPVIASREDLDATERRYRAWAMHAIENEARELSREREGARGSALNRSAYKLGGYLGSNAVDAREITSFLVDASTANGLVAKDGIDVVRATIRRGLEAGAKAPRAMPQLEERADSYTRAPAPPLREARASHDMPADPGDGGAPPPTDDDFQAPRGGGGDDLPIIFDTYDENEMARLADKYLAPDPELYQRGGSLVQVLVDDSPAAGIVRSHAQPKIAPVREPWLRALTTRRVRWMRREEGKNGAFEEKRIKPPPHAVAAIATRGHWTHIRRLEGVSTTPLFTHDGSVLTTPGYDPKTGVLFAPHEAFEPVPRTPTRQDVEDAIESLRYVVSDFPFEEPVHEATFFAALLTPLARYAFRGPSPLFLIDATTRATGKGLLAKVIGLISIGSAPTLIVPTRDEAEERKRITTIAMDAEQLVSVDNIEGRWGSPTMCIALTSDEWGDRVLGGQASYKGPLLTTWLGTGNNVTLAGDMVRRVAHIRLVTREERPESRDGFAIPNLETYVRAHRPRLVRHALTILRGWHAAGRPPAKIPNWGSYEGWSAVVRQAIVWAGLKDPVEGQRALREASDTDTDQLVSLIDGLAAVTFSTSKLTAGEVVVKSKEEKTGASLREALESYANGKQISAKGVGRLLLRLRGRILDGRFIAAEKDQHRKQWLFSVQRSDGKEVPTPELEF